MNKTCVCKGFLMVSAKYGQDEERTHPSMVAIQRKGSMDTGLWHHQLCRDCYMKCYKDHISPELVWDPAPGKLLKGPLIVKTDVGPGRLSWDAESIDFCEELARVGVYILLSLPTGIFLGDEPFFQQKTSSNCALMEFILILVDLTVRSMWYIINWLILDDSASFLT